MEKYLWASLVSTERSVFEAPRHPCNTNKGNQQAVVLSNWFWNDPDDPYLLWAVKKGQHPTVRIPVIAEPLLLYLNL